MFQSNADVRGATTPGSDEVRAHPADRQQPGLGVLTDARRPMNTSWPMA